jgi:hypothetical protein
MPSRLAIAASPWPPELANRGVAHALLALGLAGLLAELLSTMFLPRLVLYLVVLAAGAIGSVRQGGWRLWHVPGSVMPKPGRARDAS